MENNEQRLKMEPWGSQRQNKENWTIRQKAQCVKKQNREDEVSPKTRSEVPSLF